MRRRVAILVALLFAMVGFPAFAKASEAYVPELPIVDRYELIWKRRPFSPATPVDIPAQVDGIEQRFALGGLLKMGDQWTAFVLDRKSLERQSISQTTNEAGVQLVSVQEQADPKSSTIVVRAGEQTGIVRFDQGLMNAATVKASESPNEGKPPTIESALAGVPPVTANRTGNPAKPTPARTLRRTPINLSK